MRGNGGPAGSLPQTPPPTSVDGLVPEVAKSRIRLEPRQKVNALQSESQGDRIVIEYPYAKPCCSAGCPFASTRYSSTRGGFSSRSMRMTAPILCRKVPHGNIQPTSSSVSRAWRRSGLRAPACRRRRCRTRRFADTANENPSFFAALAVKRNHVYQLATSRRLHATTQDAREEKPEERSTSSPPFAKDATGFGDPKSNMIMV